MNKKEKKIISLSEQTVDKLNSDLITLKKELFNLRCQKVMSSNSDTSRFKKARRQVARVKTELSKRLQEAQ